MPPAVCPRLARRLRAGLLASVGARRMAGGVHMAVVALRLSVPRTSSTSRDQVVFADHATDATLPSDAVVTKIDRFG